MHVYRHDKRKIPVLLFRFMIQPAKTLILTILFFICTSLFADTVIMRNGQQYEGRIINQSRTSVTIISNGSPVTLQKSQIARIAYGMTAEEKEKLRKEREERQRKLEEQRREQQDKLRREQEKREKEKRIQQELKEWNRLRGNLQEKEDSEDWVLEDSTVSGKTTFGALWRSALIPGWGQWYLEENIWAGVYAGATVILAAAAANEYRIYQERQSSYDFNSSLLFLSGTVASDAAGFLPADPLQRILTTAILDDTFFQPVNNQVATVNNVSIALGVLYLANLAHTYYMTQTKSGIAGIPVDDGVYMTFDISPVIEPAARNREFAETNTGLNSQFRFIF